MILPREIRIMHLLPHNGDKEKSINCNLLVSSLDLSLKYETLSYVWGDDACLVDVEISGRKAGITKNLYSALRRPRRQDQVRSSWVDQLCINQWDTNEKAQQVRSMRHIYTKCHNCLLWMGEIPQEITADDANGALELLGCMAGVSKTGTEGGITSPSYFDSDAFLRAPSRL